MSRNLIASFLVVVSLSLGLANYAWAADSEVSVTDTGATDTVDSETSTEASKDDKGGLFGSLKLDKNKDSKSPLLIKSDTLKLNGKAKNFTYHGNVEIRRGDLFITSDTVVGTYNDKREIQTIVCEDNVVITRGDNLRASSNKAVYHVKAEEIDLTEGPELFHNGNNLTADKITLFLAEDRSKAEGNVRVKVQETQGFKAELKPKSESADTAKKTTAE